jgi:tryptophan synthase beta chain
MPDDILNSFMTGPDEKGRFGDFGGRFVSETLMPLILELEAQYENAKTDLSFWAEMDDLWTNYVGRPSPLYFAERLTDRLGGAKIYFKRDELNHTGAHKINNVLGQIILARRMGKTRIIAETGAGQHGVATATVCAKFGLKCIVYMGATDVERQAPNVFRMKLLGAEVVPVTSGRGTLKDAMNDALRDWVTNVATRSTASARSRARTRTRPWCAISSRSSARKPRQQIMERRGPPARHDHRRDRRRIERDGPVLPVPRRQRGRHHRRRGRRQGRERQDGALRVLTGGRPGVLHGNRTYLLQDEDGQILEGHSISAGLDYPGIGPEHAWLHDIGRAEYVSITDTEALEAFQLSCETEGIIPALEPHSHALPSAHVMNMCGRGDKDIALG